MTDAHDLTEPPEFDGTHTVTAVEPAWVRQEHEPGDDGYPEPVSENEAADLIDSLYEESTYDCECGVSMDNWFEVELHFAVVTDTGEK